MHACADGQGIREPEPSGISGSVWIPAEAELDTRVTLQGVYLGLQDAQVEEMDTRQGREGSRKGVRGPGKAPSHQRLQETVPHTPGSHPCANQRLGSWFTDVPSCHPLRVEGCTAPRAQQGSSKGINNQVSLTSHTCGLPARKKNLQIDIIHKWPNEGKGLASPTHQAWGIYLQTSYRDWQCLSMIRSVDIWSPHL